MKNINLLIWVTQLGLSVVAPLVGFILLSVWLQNIFSCGDWIRVVGVLLGVLGAANGLISSLKILKKLSPEDPKQNPSVSFNDHD